MKEVKRLSPFKCMCVTIGNLPTSYIESLSYYETLLWLCNYLEKTIIKGINDNTNAINELQNYVNTYFDNLDVQEEINQKLDEMAESGELVNIINEYLKFRCINVYNTVNDIKNAEELKNNQVVRTLGYYDINDGGGALYIISNINNNPNDMDKLELQNNLYATLVLEHPLNCKQVGCKGDGVKDDTLPLQRAIDLTATGCFIPKGTYKVTDTISFENKTITGENYTWVTIKGDISDDSKPILAIGGACNINDITVSYDRSAVQSDMGKYKRIGIRLYGGYRNLALQHSTLSNIQCSYCGTGIDDGGASVFSCTFNNIIINNFGRWGFHMGGTARTGNVYSNIYINNHGFISRGNADTISAYQGFMLEGEESECTISQLNVEHLTAHEPIYISNVLGLTATSIHVEGVRNRSDNQTFVYIDKSYGIIDNIAFYFTRHRNLQSLIKFGEKEKISTENDKFGGIKQITINNLVCKGLNRPDRATYGYEPEYPISASTISANSATTGFKFIDREVYNNRYNFALKSYNWITYSYGFDDSNEYKSFNMNPHNSINVIELPRISRTCNTNNKPTEMLYDGLIMYDYITGKLIIYDNGLWHNCDGSNI